MDNIQAMTIQGVRTEELATKEEDFKLELHHDYIEETNKKRYRGNKIPG